MGSFRGAGEMVFRFCERLIRRPEEDAAGLIGAEEIPGAEISRLQQCASKGVGSCGAGDFDTAGKYAVGRGNAQSEFIGAEVYHAITGGQSDVVIKWICEIAAFEIDDGIGKRDDAGRGIGWRSVA